MKGGGACSTPLRQFQPPSALLAPFTTSPSRPEAPKPYKPYTLNPKPKP